MQQKLCKKDDDDDDDDRAGAAAAGIIMGCPLDAIGSQFDVCLISVLLPLN